MKNFNLYKSLTLFSIICFGINFIILFILPYIQTVLVSPTYFGILQTVMDFSDTTSNSSGEITTVYLVLFFILFLGYALNLIGVLSYFMYQNPYKGVERCCAFLFSGGIYNLFFNASVYFGVNVAIQEEVRYNGYSSSSLGIGFYLIFILVIIITILSFFVKYRILLDVDNRIYARLEGITPPASVRTTVPTSINPIQNNAINRNPVNHQNNYSNQVNQNINPGYPAEIVCNYCGTKNSPGTRNCTNCGSKL